LPGSIALARMSTEFYRIKFLLDILENNPSEKVRVDIERAIAALAEYQSTHILFHQDLNKHNSISLLVENYNRLVTEYLLATQKNNDKSQVKELEVQLQNMVEEFTFVVTPHIDKDIKESYQEVSLLKNVYRSSNNILWSFSIVITFILIVISLYFSNLVTKPLDSFIKLIEQYGNGKEVNFESTSNYPKEIQNLKNVLENSIKKRIDAEELLSHQANHDALTGLPNRYLSVDRLNQLILEAKRYNHLVAVMFIDLDDFKKFNDSLGHDVGDKILRCIAKQLKSSVRAEDTIGRLGGDEFIGVFGSLNSIVDAQPLAETIISLFQKPFDIDGKDFNLSGSIGISFYPDDGNDSSELLKKADTAMYHSKVSGKNIYSFHSEEMYKAVKRRLEVEENLVLALEKNEFEVFLQPKYKTSPIEICGFEALVRWNNSNLGKVSPEEFIPVAEQTGFGKA
jgi:diguanylate cyclase (GGDEF)-like protein